MENRKRRLPDSLAVIAGLLALLIGGLIALLACGGEYDEWERRYLADRPSTPDLADWQTDRETERFLADHIPGRRMLVAADSSGLLLTGRGSRLGAWYADGCLVEPPVEANDSTVESKLRRFEKLADQAGVPWTVLTPPSHGWLIRSRMSSLMADVYAAEDGLYQLLESCENAVMMPEAFAADPDTMYYRTDHHWTLQGAYQAYLALAAPLGYEPLPIESFRITRYAGFRGTTISRSGLPPLWQDELVCAEPESPVSLTVLDKSGESTWDRLIFPEDAETQDGYAVYLHGNHGTVIIDRPEASEGTLAVFRDSMASCLLPMLSAHFRRTIAVDARYEAGSFSDTLAGCNDLKAILFLYSPDSLVNDTEILRKAR